MKRDKLLTVNKWNKNRINGRKFDIGGPIGFTPNISWQPIGSIGNMNNSPVGKSQSLIPETYNEQDSAPHEEDPHNAPSKEWQTLTNNVAKNKREIAPLVDLSKVKLDVNVPKIEGPSWMTKFSNWGSNTGIGKFGSTPLGGSALGAAGTIANQLGHKLISNGLSTKAGDAIASIGGTAGDVVGMFNPLAGMIVKAGTGVIGGLTNAAWGKNINQERLDRNNRGNDYLNGFNSNAGSFAGIKGPKAVSNVENAYRGGWFKKDWASKSNQNQVDLRAEALSHAQRSIDNNVHNISDDNLNDYLASYAAFGGPLNVGDSIGGAIDYGFTSDYLTMKDKQVQAKNNNMNNPVFNNFGTGSDALFANGGNIHINPKNKGSFTASAKRHGMGVQQYADQVLAHPENYSPLERRRANFARNASKWNAFGGPLGNDTLFALGGDLQTNGADWSTGLRKIDAGGSHESNPYEGVQMGIAPDNQPNLVEEGETIFNDYVFSNRIKPDKDVLKRFHMYSKGGKMTYADVSKKLEKEAQERPNDPISQASLKKQLGKLAEAQEEQKVREMAKEAQKAFEAMTPEQQAAVMQQVQQAGQQEEQGEQEGQQDEEQQPTDEEAAAQQDQQAAQQPEGEEEDWQDYYPQGRQMASEEDEQQMAAEQAAQQAAQAQQAQEAAFGGKLKHRFDDGGSIGAAIKSGLYRALGFGVDSDFNKWWNTNKIGTPIDFSKYTMQDLMQNVALLNAIKKVNPALANALATGYDFGIRKNDLAHQIITSLNRGNWADAVKNNTGWHGSTDPMYLQAIENYMKANDLTDRNAAIAGMDKLKREDLENLFKATDAYQKTTVALHDENNALQYLNAILNDKDAPQDAKNWALRFVENGKWKTGVSHTYDDVFDKDRKGNAGKGVRSAYPGSYWHTFLPVYNKNKVIGRLINNDGTIEDIVEGADTSGFDNAGTYNFNTVGDDGINVANTINYYKRKPAPKPEKGVEDFETDPSEHYMDLRKGANLRYMAALEPITQIAMQSFGVGKPSYKDLDKSIEYLKQPTHMAGYETIGNYLTYNPMDVWREQNRMEANTNAANRAIMNSGSTAGGKMAGITSNLYNEQTGLGDLYAKALEYNDKNRQAVGEFNRGTDKFNAEAYNQNSQFNAGQLNNATSLLGQYSLNAAKEKLDTDASWIGNLYGNVGKIFSNIADIGREDAYYNQVASLANTGVTNPSEWMGSAISGNYYRPRSSAAGGKLKKKRRGLTY